MATKTKNIEEEVKSPMVFGDGEEPQIDPVTPPADQTPGDTSTNEPATEEMSLQESIQAQLKRGSQIVDMGPNYKTTYEATVKDANLNPGAAQAPNMQTATTIGNRIPQVDTTEYAVRSRFAANGQNAGQNSDFAVKATSEGFSFKPTKDVKKNAFPETGAAYKEIVNTQSY
jgi:hypothetical protein